MNRLFWVAKKYLPAARIGGVFRARAETRAWRGMRIVAVTGCHSERPHVNPTASGNSLPPTPPALSRDAAQLAEAHAHYAAAVIHTLNGDQTAALQDYFKAAMGDPGDEALVLGVLQRLEQHKEFDKARQALARSAERPNAS